MLLLDNISSLISVLDKYRSENKTIGFVPTMGALHQGHLSLLDACNASCDISVVSIFVNPTQFNDKSDFINYPITIDDDIIKLKAASCDILFLPSIDEIYSGIYQSFDCGIDFGLLESVMEGAFRPGHFKGVAQIVTILFEIVLPDKAFFGEKDFQQLAIIKSLVSRYSFTYPIQIVSCDIIREDDGLAMSSRNIRLNKQARLVAPKIFQILNKSKLMIDHYTVNEVEKWVRNEILHEKEFQLEYFEIVNYLNLQAASSWNNSDGVIGCIALYCGGIRLIDNIRYKNSL